MPTSKASSTASILTGLNGKPVWTFLLKIPGTLLVTGLTLIGAMPEAGWQGWQFDQSSGSLGTALTSHLLHYDANHLFWDLAVFIGVGAALELKWRRLFLTTLLVSALAIPPLAVFWQASVTTYRGLSGIDTALFAAYATGEWLGCWREQRKPEACVFALLILAMVAKSLFELVTGCTLFVSSEGFTPLPVAHLIGATTGMGLAYAGWRSESTQPTAE